jgi:hypothetical protein
VAQRGQILSVQMSVPVRGIAVVYFSRIWKTPENGKLKKKIPAGGAIAIHGKQINKCLEPSLLGHL